MIVTNHEVHEEHEESDGRKKALFVAFVPSW
jgi:hypothetical protein